MEKDEVINVRRNIVIKPSIERQTINLGKVQKLKKFFGSKTKETKKKHSNRVFEFVGDNTINESETSSLNSECISNSNFDISENVLKLDDLDLKSEDGIENDSIFFTDMVQETADDSGPNIAHQVKIEVTPSDEVEPKKLKLPKMMNELLENEEIYVKTLEKGIENYVNMFSEARMIPRKMQGLKYHLFSNIENIYEFHRDILLPRLKEVGDDLVKIADVFIDLIDKDHFYCYIQYAINNKRSEELCHANNGFFEGRKYQCEDLLGVFAFIVSPIQRIPRYQLLMSEIVKELLKNIDDYKQEIFKACRAKKAIVQLLQTINDALSVHDIKNCKIDLKLQGKFKRMSEFRIKDEEQSRKYNGKVFFYEKSIIYTERKDNAHLEYSGFFDCSLLGIVYSKKSTEFILERYSNKKTVKFHSNDENVIVEWLTLLEEVLTESIKAIYNNKKERPQYELSQLNIPDCLNDLENLEFVGYRPK